MAHFYGLIQGKGLNSVTRTGTPNSGMISEVMGYKGRIEVHLYTLAGEDHFEVRLLNHPDQPEFSKDLVGGVLNTDFHKEETNA